MALSVLLLGSVAVLALFAVGVNALVDRQVDSRLEIIRPEVRMLVQDAVDRVAAGRAPEDIPPTAQAPPRPLSPRGYGVRVKFKPAESGAGHVAAAVLYYQGRPVRVFPPIPVSRSTLDPTQPR